MKKLHKAAKILEEDFKLIVQNLFSNNPGLGRSKQVPIESVGHSIWVLMSKLASLRVSVLEKFKAQTENDNNIKFS